MTGLANVANVDEAVTAGLIFVVADVDDAVTA